MSTLAYADRNSMSLHSSLEWKYIQDFLSSKGYQMEDIRMMPAIQVKRIMTEACSHVSLKLAELESIASFMGKIQYK
jgi:hypothetical protein